MISALILWGKNNPLYAVIALLSVIVILSLGYYKARAAYLDMKLDRAECVIESQNKTIKSVGNKNEIHRAVDRLGDSDVHKRLLSDWCRDCQLLPAR